jgi:hypothetical protein
MPRDGTVHEITGGLPAVWSAGAHRFVEIEGDLIVLNCQVV